MRRRKLTEVIIAALASSIASHGAFAQAAEEPENQFEIEEVVVTGVRGSLRNSMDLKRNADGVVDAISAQDIGKFPDTNLAESLQRITGVSIDRVNGEGSEVTVRGFGGQYNLVTVNGRQMPTANVATVGGDQNADTEVGSDRSFDFSNLAAEGVQALEVYKTGKANFSSGGIGATVNIRTFRPLENPGTQASATIKAMHDSSVEFSGDDFTPEVSGLFSTTSDDGRWGVSIFGSYQDRNSASRSATVNNWNIEEQAFVLDPANGRLAQGASVSGASGDPTQLLSFPNDSRYHLAEAERERTNGQMVLQFAPSDSLTLTFDALYAKNTQRELRADQTNWLNRPFSTIELDGNTDVSTLLYIQEDIAGVKDTGFEQQLRATEDTIESLGFNARWDFSDTMAVNFDVHSSQAEVRPDGPLGHNSILFGMGAPIVAAQELDFRSGFPVQTIVMDDALRGNGNGVLDVGDLGSQVARTVTSTQDHEIDQARLDFDWAFNDSSRFEVGLDFRDSTMIQTRRQTQQTLGDWGISNPGDIPADLVEEYCLTCLFDDFDPMSSGASLVAFRGDAGDLYSALSPLYASQGNPVNVTNNEFNQVDEDILAGYFQFTMNGELADMPVRISAGLRYEETDVTSQSNITIPQAIIWQSDNDFSIIASTEQLPVSQDASYDNFLPSVDFALEFNEDMVGRFSYSKTIARAGYGDLFFQDDPTAPPRPTAIGGIPTGTSGNPGLLPLESDNIDVSFEWYYGNTSYVSVGLYDKRVDNFIGTGQINRSLFGLRDPSSGAPGTRSGMALDALSDLGLSPSDVNLFTMTALIDNMSLSDAITTFTSNLNSDGNLDQAFIDQILADFDIVADANDPLFDFEVNGPINTESAEIYGVELAIQHFFGDSGFGIQANYTTVDGDVEFDSGGAPGVDQFALLGLSDSANIVAIYEDYGYSVRLAYNWRDNFLADANRGGGNRNPTFVDDYGQLDLYASYQINDQWLVSLEAINLTEESYQTYGRDLSNVWFQQELDTRVLLGIQYSY